MIFVEVSNWLPTERRLEEETLPAWSQKTSSRRWKQLSEDHRARNVSTKGIMWKSTDCLRHVW